MKTRLQSPRFAALVMVLMIAAASVLGGARSLHRLQQEVYTVFFDGADGDGIGVFSDIRKNRTDAYNLLGVARGAGLEQAPLTALEQAVQAVDAAGEDPAALIRAHSSLMDAVRDVYERMGSLSLPQQDEDYRQNLYRSILARADTMSRDEYNARAQQFNRALERFPASALRYAAGVQTLPQAR